MSYGKHYTTIPSKQLNGAYIIWSPGASRPPQMVYETRADAIKAAYAMAARFGGQRFMVCKMVGACKAEGVTYQDFEEEAKAALCSGVSLYAPGTK